MDKPFPASHLLAFLLCEYTFQQILAVTNVSTTRAMLTGIVNNKLICHCSSVRGGRIPHTPN